MGGVNRFQRENGGMLRRLWWLALPAIFAAAGCATSPDPSLPSPGLTTKSMSTTGSSSGDTPASGDDSCTTCSGSGGGSASGGGSGSGGGSVGPEDSSAPSGDATTPGDDGSTDSGDDGGTPPFTLPPLTLPDSGGSSSDDGGPNSCTSKICIDPVFDCPLQGCFNGCTNFHCM